MFGRHANSAMLLDGLARGDKGAADRPGRLKPGTVLVREYQGKRHTVTVVADGFLWGDSTYRSLTTIARAITGTAWSGPRFFGVRPNRNGMRDVDSEQVVTSVRTPDAPRYARRSNGLSPRARQKVQR